MNVWSALRVDGVIGKNHIPNFDSYCDNIFNAIVNLMRETQVEIPDDIEITFDSKNNITEDQPSLQPQIDSKDKVEMEKIKAYKKREYVKQLEAKIEQIQKKAEKEISEIKKKTEGIYGIDE